MIVKRWVVFFIFSSVFYTTHATAHNYLLAMNANMYGLQYTDNDRKIMANALRTHYGKTISINQINNVTHTSYRAAMKYLQQTVRKNDHVIVYFSGHGKRVLDQNGDEADNQDEALVFFHPKNVDDLLLDDELSADIKRLAAKRVTLIMDTCHSGGMNKNYWGQGVVKYRHNPQIAHLSAKQLLQEDTSSINDSAKGVLFAASSEEGKAVEYKNVRGGIFSKEFSMMLTKTNNMEQAFDGARQNVIRITRRHQIPKRSTYRY